MIAVAHTLKTEKIAREKAKATHLRWVRAVSVASTASTVVGIIQEQDGEK